MSVRDRFGTHTVTEAQFRTISDITEVFLSTAQWLDDALPDGRYKSLVLTALEEAETWAHKGVVR